VQDANTKATKKEQQQNSAIFYHLWHARPQEAAQEIVSTSEELQCNFDYCNRLFTVNTAGHRRAFPCSPHSRGGTEELRLPPGHKILSTAPRPRGLRQSTGVWQPKSQSIPPGATGGCCCYRRVGWGCRLRTGETSTIFLGLLANTVVSEHLLLYLSSSHCPQALLGNSRDYPHTLFLICVYLSLEKAQRSLLHTPAKYNKTEYSSSWSSSNSCPTIDLPFLSTFFF